MLRLVGFQCRLWDLRQASVDPLQTACTFNPSCRVEGKRIPHQELIVSVWQVPNPLCYLPPWDHVHICATIWTKWAAWWINVPKRFTEQLLKFYCLVAYFHPRLFLCKSWKALELRICVGIAAGPKKPVRPFWRHFTAVELSAVYSIVTVTCPMRHCAVLVWVCAYKPALRSRT